MFSIACTKVLKSLRELSAEVWARRTGPPRPPRELPWSTSIRFKLSTSCSTSYPRNNTA